jgi:hypothetical protein
MQEHPTKPQASVRQPPAQVLQGYLQPRAAGGPRLATGTAGAAGPAQGISVPAAGPGGAPLSHPHDHPQAAGPAQALRAMPGTSLPSPGPSSWPQRTLSRALGLQGAQ